MSKTDKPSFDIDYIARLARLELTDSERSRFEEQLGKIIDYFQELQSTDTDGVEPTAHANPIYDVMRDDTPGETLSPSDALANAPDAANGQVRVPRVVE